MPVQEIHFETAELPSLERGQPVGVGFFMNLSYLVTGLNVAIGDDVVIYAKVPSDEHWYVMAVWNYDATGTGVKPNLWEALSLWLKIPNFISPAISVGGDPAGPWQESALWTQIWSDWDAAGIEWWDSSLAYPQGRRVIRPSNEVFSVCRWQAGTPFHLRQDQAKIAGGVGKSMEMRLQVIRYRTVDEDFKRMKAFDAEFLEKDLHRQAHQVILSE